MAESGRIGPWCAERDFLRIRFGYQLVRVQVPESGKVIAFGGRALREGDEPKYLNSPETPIYKKSTVLYNLHRAKIDARKHDRMILVEGYMDAIGVYSAGIHEVVASSGTALSTMRRSDITRGADLAAPQEAVRRSPSAGFAAIA